jgi:hypothetical protein
MRRLEAYPRSHGIEDGLAARVHDALWMLTRQWEFGEFRAEDAASPAWVDSEAEVHLVDQWRPRDSPTWRSYDRGREPLEELVEREPAEHDPRLRIEAGLQLRRLLGARSLDALLPGFVQRCPFPRALTGGPPAAIRSRLPDGSLLAVSMGRVLDENSQDDEFEALRVPLESRGAVVEVASEWMDWWAARAPHRSDNVFETWDENRLEYSFAVRASSLPEMMLAAPEYSGGRLDWWTFDAAAADPASPPQGAPAAAPERPPLRTVPAPARFGGMPVPRFWEMQDARFDPGGIDAAPTDLGRMLMVAFVTNYGNDWFTLPLRLPVASLSRIARFAVTDVFGTTTELGAAGADEVGWNLYGLTDGAQGLSPEGKRLTSPWFFLAPTLPQSQESDPLETVLLLRDEMANLAWAVEATISDDTGRQVDRLGQWAARPVPDPGPLDPPRYRVDTRVPDHWFPLAPAKLEHHESIKLRLLPLARRVAGEVVMPLPIGRLLEGARRGALWLYEEEVPRSGARLVRTAQYARWHDGSIHRWIGRRKTSGGGEGSSGLRFDVVETEE